VRLQIASDLHHEMASGELAQPLQPASDAQALVLAGDIASGIEAIDLYANYAVPVIYVHGNQEAFGHAYPALVDRLRERAKGTAVRFLQNEEVELGGVRFLGASMWTDYCLHPLNLADALSATRKSTTDHRSIRRIDSRFFQPEDALEHQRETLRWLNERLDERFSGKTVVVTHHTPSGMSIPQINRQHHLAAADATNVERLVVKANVWIHGHIHATSDYTIGDCRVICNPRGRPGRNRTKPELPYENADFRPTLVVDV
jgi:predicted phosphodiesterase